MNFGSKTTKSKPGAWAKHPGCLRRRGRPGTAPRPWVGSGFDRDPGGFERLKAELQGLFERRQAQRHASLAGGHCPSALGPVLVTVTAKLQGFFERRQAQRHASLVGGHYPSAPWSGSR
ncbi:hypothetical protein G5714_024631 [Onychostoma macrolepis]|uniref:Uncharacterized protein n=1 Tax=Onychostoma macrolepis TaxID=369639 RepID=A0A7J6BH89_9TELE|nr:hypothetical protein G5714_024631 [Onychostoma macrolepis]